MENRKKLIAGLVAIAVLACAITAAVLLPRSNGPRYTHEAIVIENEGYLAVGVTEVLNSPFPDLGLHYINVAEGGLQVADAAGNALSVEDLAIGTKIRLVDETPDGPRIEIYPPSLTVSHIEIVGTASPAEYADALDSLNSMRTWDMEIYSVRDGVLVSETHTVIQKQSVIFGLWKETNVLDDAVTLLAYTQDDNSYETHNGDGSVSYTRGDTAYVTLEIGGWPDGFTLAENQLLLEGLCRTMLGAHNTYITAELTVLVDGTPYYKAEIVL